VGAMREDLKGILGGLNSLAKLSEAQVRGNDALYRAQGWGEQVMEDPSGTAQLLLNYGLNEVKGRLFEEVVRPLVGRYLANDDMTADEYLRSVRVVKSEKEAIKINGLNALEFHDWGNSSLIDKNGNVKLVVNYEVEYTFGNLPLPFSPTLKITQTVVTKAWLDGSGKGYK